MKARKILLIVTGKRKSNIIAQCLRKMEINTDMPATTLLLHNNLTVLLDEDAASIYVKEKKMTENEDVNKKYSNNTRRCDSL